MKIKIKEKKKWYAENDFYQLSDPNRIFKLIYHYEIYKKILKVKGDVFEFGVFKGASIIRLLTFAKLLDKNRRSFYGFDTFGKFPTPQKKYDKKFVKMWKNAAGDASDDKHIAKILNKKRLKNFKFIKGDIFLTLDKFLKSYKKKIALLHLDLDTYDITKFVLKKIYKNLAKSSVILVDDYNSTVGATKAVNEFLKEKNCQISVLKNHKNPYYILVNKIKN